MQYSIIQYTEYTPVQYTPSTVSHQVTISYEEPAAALEPAPSVRAATSSHACDPSYPLLLILHLCEGYTNISCLLILGPRLIVRCGGWEWVEPGVGRVELFLGEHVGEQLGKLARSLHLHTALPRLKQPGGRPTLAHPRHVLVELVLSSTVLEIQWKRFFLHVGTSEGTRISSLGLGTAVELALD